MIIKKAAETDNNVKSGELGELRRALDMIENLRFSPDLSEVDVRRLEEASVELRNREREIVASIGSKLAGEIMASSVSMKELTERIKMRTEKLSKLPKGLDRFSEVILEIIDIARRVGREL